MWLWCPAREQLVHVEATRTAFRDVRLQEVKVEGCLRYRVRGCRRRLEEGCLVGTTKQGRFEAGDKEDGEETKK